MLTQVGHPCRLGQVITSYHLSPSNKGAKKFSATTTVVITTPTTATPEVNSLQFVELAAEAFDLGLRGCVSRIVMDSQRF